MIKQLKDDKKVLELKNLLNDFLDDGDCYVSCDKCEDKKIRDHIYRLENEITKHMKKESKI